MNKYFLNIQSDVGDSMFYYMIEYNIEKRIKIRYSINVVGDVNHADLDDASIPPGPKGIYKEISKEEFECRRTLYL